MENITGIPVTPENSNEQEPLLPKVEKIINQLKSNEGKKPSAWGNLSILVVTVLLFLVTGLINNPLTDIFVIIIVVLIHELGHLAAMKIFGYKDVKMFFIPLFGAAVTGVNDNVSASKKAVIALAGPVPGIIIGLLLIIVSAAAYIPVLYHAAIMFIVLNLLNLLPLYPFDGGRFMTELFFSRNNYVELIFKLAAAGVLIAAAVFISDIILAIVGIFILLTAGPSYKVASLASEIKARNEFIYEGKILDQGNNILNSVVSELIKKFPELKGEKPYANLLSDLWERLKYVPPKTASAVGLSLVYFGSFAVVLAFFFFASIYSQKGIILEKQDTLQNSISKVISKGS